LHSAAATPWGAAAVAMTSIKTAEGRVIFTRSFEGILLLYSFAQPMGRGPRAQLNSQR
jgi:hypothetical protein